MQLLDITFHTYVTNVYETNSLFMHVGSKYAKNVPNSIEKQSQP